MDFDGIRYSSCIICSKIRLRLVAQELLRSLGSAKARKCHGYKEELCEVIQKRPSDREPAPDAKDLMR